MAELTLPDDVAAARLVEKLKKFLNDPENETAARPYLIALTQILADGYYAAGADATQPLSKYLRTIADVYEKQGL